MSIKQTNDFAATAGATTHYDQLARFFARYASDHGSLEELSDRVTTDLDEKTPEADPWNMDPPSGISCRIGDTDCRIVADEDWRPNQDFRASNPELVCAFIESLGVTVFSHSLDLLEDGNDYRQFVDDLCTSHGLTLLGCCRIDDEIESMLIVQGSRDTFEQITALWIDLNERSGLFEESAESE